MIWARRPAHLMILAMLLASAGSARAERILAIETRPGDAAARLLFLPDDRARLDAPLPEGVTRVTVTGAYSSGDAFRPEGLTIRAGEATRPWPQGWDGLLLIDADGVASVHNMSRVQADGRRFDLRDRRDRTMFLALAEERGFSAVQSHLLISDGALDVRPVAGAPTARRRLLFQTSDGRLGIYDSSPDSMTLYEAARALEEAVGPAMALNLDMGTYDFCEIRTSSGALSCGLLARPQIEKLTNLVEISIPAVAGD